MLLNAELLLQYQRCQRRIFLDTHGRNIQRDPVSDLVLKLQQDRNAHQKSVLAQTTYHKPQYHRDDVVAGAGATLDLMQQGVECIHHGLLLLPYGEDYTLISRPDLLIKQPGQSCFGDWMYIPATIELGKRPKQEYQIVAAFHALVLAAAQEFLPPTAWMMLRASHKNSYRPPYVVDVNRWLPQMQTVLDSCIQTLEAAEAPEVFISRQRCGLCRWHSHCYAIAKQQRHLSLLPGVSPSRYSQLQAVDLTTVESLAQADLAQLENLPGFDSGIAHKLLIQAQSTVENRPILLDNYSQLSLLELDAIQAAPVEIYFDIEAEPDLNLDYLLGVLIVDKQAKTEKFYSLLAEQPHQEELIWEQFLALVEKYPTAPIYHFCGYEVDTVKRLAKLYRTPWARVRPLLNRFIDVYEQVTQTVALPVESYALKAIAKWLSFTWRDPEASGAKCIYWYDQWLTTGDRNLLDIIQRYNEDDCRATRIIKDWFSHFIQNESRSECN